MPCSCDGFAFERTYFGKTYRGYSGGFVPGTGADIPEKFNWHEVVHDGEKALCRAQSIIKDLLAAADDCRRDHIPKDLRRRAEWEIKLLEEHKAKETAAS